MSEEVKSSSSTLIDSGLLTIRHQILRLDPDGLKFQARECNP